MEAFTRDSRVGTHSLKVELLEQKGERNKSLRVDSSMGTPGVKMESKANGVSTKVPCNRDNEQDTPI